MFLGMPHGARRWPVLRLVCMLGTWSQVPSKNATVGECRDQAEERRASVRGVRGIPLVCGLEDLAEAAVLHRVQGLDRVEVFGEKRAGAGCLLCVGDLEGFRQGHQTLDRLVVGFADLLGLVGVHRLEDLAKGCVGCCVWVVCVGHVCVSVSEKGLNRLRDDTHEPCGFDNLKPSLRNISERFCQRSFPRVGCREVRVLGGRICGPLLTIYAKDVERGSKELARLRRQLGRRRIACSVFPQEEQFCCSEFCKFRFSFTCIAEIAFSEIDPGHAAGLVGQHGLGVVNRVLGSSQHALARRLPSGRCASGIIHSRRRSWA